MVSTPLETNALTLVGDDGTPTPPTVVVGPELVGPVVVGPVLVGPVLVGPVLVGPVVVGPVVVATVVVVVDVVEVVVVEVVVVAGEQSSPLTGSSKWINQLGSADPLAPARASESRTLPRARVVGV
jgi:hypothetical protein